MRGKRRVEENTAKGGTFENLQVALLNFTPEPREVKAMLGLCQ